MPEGSKFVGQTIADIRSEEHDINVLTLYRNSKAIPNPKSSRVLEPNDKLLCFGKLEVMRGMIPVKTRRRRQPDVASLPTDAISASDVESVE
ncbi:cation:proton antiporter regulatory subunit [Microbulbifer hainanensis]|uniref:cation:proton antiporter regulatory subunit n=1 Tax=Microbulbifer hainanensis TaxID=2735675 RepID=UPI0038575B65